MAGVPIFGGGPIFHILLDVAVRLIDIIGAIPTPFHDCCPQIQPKIVFM